MAFPTLAELSTMLTTIGFPKHECVDEPNEEVGMIRTGCGTPFGPILINIDPQKEKNVLQVRAHVGTAPGASNDKIQLETLQYINHLNASHIVGKFIFDHSSNDVYVDCAQVITEHDVFTQTTLNELIDRIVIAGTLWRPELLDVGTGSKIFDEATKTLEDVDLSNHKPLTDEELAELIRKVKGT